MIHEKDKSKLYILISVLIFLFILSNILNTDNKPSTDINEFIEIHNGTIERYSAVNCDTNFVFPFDFSKQKLEEINGTCYYVEIQSLTEEESNILHKLNNGSYIAYVGE